MDKKSFLPGQKNLIGDRDLEWDPEISMVKPPNPQFGAVENTQKFWYVATL